MIFVGNKDNVSRDTGFNVTKDIICEYNNINVIESKGYLSFYNIKRKVIKLSNYCYYGKSLSAISLSLIEAGISVINKNKYIDLIRRFFTNLKWLYLFPILSMLINFVTYTIGDVRVSLIFIVSFTFFTYILIDIKTSVLEWIGNSIISLNSINKDSSIKVISYINKLLWVDKFIFLGELIIIVRFVMILLKL